MSIQCRARYFNEVFSQNAFINYDRNIPCTRQSFIIKWIRTLIAFLCLIGRITTVKSDVNMGQLSKAERHELINQWAPLVWLHSKEKFYPSSVEEFLLQVKPSKHGKMMLVINNGETETIFPSLPRGQESRDTYLMASYNVECQSCPLPKYMFGKMPKRDFAPPTYAIIDTCTHERKGKSFLSNTNMQDQELLMRTSANTNTSQKISEGHISGHPSIQSAHNIQSNSSAGLSLDPHTKYFGNKNSSVNMTEGTPINENLTVSTNEGQIVDLKFYEGIESGYVHNETYKQIDVGISKTLPDDTSIKVTIDESTHLERTPFYKRKRQTQRTFTESPGEAEPALHTKLKQLGMFTVTYWMFYPYNHGKEVCTTKLFFMGRILQPKIGGKCYSEEIHMGSHVGDWEHITIQFEGLMPKLLYISSHNFGAIYSYDKQNHVFHYQSQDTREGFPMFPGYPKYLHMHENRPVIYAALGSHGFWPSPGTHQYNSIPVLEDKTDHGMPWFTSQNLEIIDFTELTPFQRFWLSYEGRWGNPKYNCHALMGGFCEINDGPTGIPMKRINFPCPG